MPINPDNTPPNSEQKDNSDKTLNRAVGWAWFVVIALVLIFIGYSEL